jgi:hypothetical protein
MSNKSLIIQRDSAELFEGPKILAVKDYAAMELSAGTHTLTLTSERPFLVIVVPSSEVDHA